MKPFFTKADFPHNPNSFGFGVEYITKTEAVDLANAKLERECVRVFSQKFTDGSYDSWSNELLSYDDHVALLLPPEPIEKPECKHPINRIFGSCEHTPKAGYECLDCGARVKPTSFEEAE